MNTLNLLLITIFGFLASNKESAGTLSDLARLAKGRILASLIKEGMAPKEVYDLLGIDGPICSGGGISNAFWDGYGIRVTFAYGDGKYDHPHVIDVAFRVPAKLKWEKLCRHFNMQFDFPFSKKMPITEAPDSK